MVNLPSVDNYGNYSSDNYGAHSLRFSTPQVLFYFLYSALVAFKLRGNTVPDTLKGQLFVRKNEWGATTGKHLNWIDGETKRTGCVTTSLRKCWSCAMEQRNKKGSDARVC